MLNEKQYYFMISKYKNVVNMLFAVMLGISSNLSFASESSIFFKINSIERRDKNTVVTDLNQVDTKMDADVFSFGYFISEQDYKNNDLARRKTVLYKKNDNATIRSLSLQSSFDEKKQKHECSGKAFFLRNKDPKDNILYKGSYEFSIVEEIDGKNMYEIKGSLPELVADNWTLLKSESELNSNVPIYTLKLENRAYDNIVIKTIEPKGDIELAANSSSITLNRGDFININFNEKQEQVSQDDASIKVSYSVNNNKASITILIKKEEKVVQNRDIGTNNETLDGNTKKNSTSSLIATSSVLGIGGIISFLYGKNAWQKVKELEEKLQNTKDITKEQKLELVKFLIDAISKSKKKAVSALITATNKPCSEQVIKEINKLAEAIQENLNSAYEYKVKSEADLIKLIELSTNSEASALYAKYLAEKCEQDGQCGGGSDSNSIQIMFDKQTKINTQMLKLQNKRLGGAKNKIKKLGLLIKQSAAQTKELKQQIKQQTQTNTQQAEKFDTIKAEIIEAQQKIENYDNKIKVLDPEKTKLLKLQKDMKEQAEIQQLDVKIKLQIKTEEFTATQNQLKQQKDTIEQTAKDQELIIKKAQNKSSQKFSCGSGELISKVSTRETKETSSLSPEALLLSFVETEVKKEALLFSPNLQKDAFEEAKETEAFLLSPNFKNDALEEAKKQK